MRAFPIHFAFGIVLAAGACDRQPAAISQATVCQPGVATATRGGYTANVDQNCDGTFLASVYDSTANLVFSMTGPSHHVGSGAGDYWYFAATLTTPSTSGYLGTTSTSSTAPSDIAQEAFLKYIGSQDTAQGLTPYDNKGCDYTVVPGGGNAGNDGTCCDAHDACYKVNGCTSGSWWWQALPINWSACDTCNNNLISCSINCLGPLPLATCGTSGCLTDWGSGCGNTCGNTWANAQCSFVGGIACTTICKDGYVNQGNHQTPPFPANLTCAGHGGVFTGARVQPPGVSSNRAICIVQE